MGMGMFCLCLVKSSLCYVCYVQRKKFERVAARFCSSSKRDCYWYLLFHTATKSLSSWYLVHCVHWYMGTLTSTLHTVGLGLVFGCGNLPCVCVKHLKRCKTSNLHLTRHVFCLRFLTSFGFQPEFQQRFQFEFQQRQGSAAWLWDRTERSYHNHGILVWSTQRTCHFCLSNFC